jgi:Fe-S-cluster-containing dehydrogenase component
VTESGSASRRAHAVGWPTRPHRQEEKAVPNEHTASDDLVGGGQWAREVLADTGHDTELGLAIARDAQRVLAGELDEGEFHTRYHEAFVDAFGVDDRPRLADGLTRPARAAGPARRELPLLDDQAGPSGCGAMTGCGEDGDHPLVSRRKMLGMLGGAAAGMLFLGQIFQNGARAAADAAASTGSGGATTGLAAGATTAAPGQKLPVQFGMVIDLDRCDGCLMCVDACDKSNGLSDGALWPYVFAYQEPDDVDTRFLVRLCQQCTRAPCVMVCPTAARHRRLADGLVLTDYDTCIGCRYCQVACPYGVNVFQFAEPFTYGGSFSGERRDAYGRSVAGDPPRGVMGKCTFCPQRQDDPETRGTTSCSLACSMNAIHVGDLNDPDSAPSQYLARRREAASGNLSTFRLLEDLGTGPSIIYIGHPPSPRAEIVEGPVSYEDWGLTSDRRAVLEGPAAWFQRSAALEGEA